MPHLFVTQDNPALFLPPNPLTFQRIRCDEVAGVSQALGGDKRRALHIEAGAKATLHRLLEATLERMSYRLGLLIDHAIKDVLATGADYCADEVSHDAMVIDVLAMLANGWEYFVANPCLEALSFFFPAFQDQAVKVPLTDKGQRLSASGREGVTTGYTLFSAVI